MQKKTLMAHGAASESVVQEMARGVIASIGSNISLSISGIMGPGGGSEEKLVGTVWLAVADKSRVVTEKLTIGKSRITNIQYASVKPLDLVRRFLLRYV